MKIYLKIFIILAFFSSLALIGCRSGTETLQNEPRGFRGIKWGTDVYRVPGLVLLENNGKKRIYARDCDELTLDKVKVAAILYSFYEDRFYEVTIKFTTLPTYHAIRKKVFAIHGTGFADSNVWRNKWTWPGEQVDLELTYNYLNEQGHIKYSYLPLTDKEYKDKARKVRLGE